MSDPVRLCLDGRIGPELAIARLLLAGETPEAIDRRIRAAEEPGAAWAALARALAAHRASLPRLRHMLAAAAIDHEGSASPTDIATMFDRAVALAPEASVAFYSLGSAAALDAATGELVAWLGRERLVSAQTDVLDLGCGIGRLSTALADLAHAVVGLDISAGMIAEAERRRAGRGNLRFLQTAGTDLSALDDRSMDLVLAVDSFPYLYQAGTAERHVADAARVLRPGGHLAIVNLSYRDDREADRADARLWAGRHGLMLRCCGLQPFRAWDGAVYLLAR